MMCGILRVTYLINMDTGLSMMPEVLLVIKCLILFGMELGTGLVPDLIFWCKFRVDCWKIVLGGMTFLFGGPLLENILVLRPGSRFGLECRK
jgi:hypothetical protein